MEANFVLLFLILRRLTILVAHFSLVSPGSGQQHKAENKVSHPMIERGDSQSRLFVLVPR